MRLLIATTNPDKLREIRHLLAHVPVDLVSLRDLPPFPEPEETGTTFQENARLKALYYNARTRADPPRGPRGSSAVGCEIGPFDYTVAEDSGLVVDALDGEPGVHSARFLRADASYPERFAEIYRRLAERPGRPRTARFVCALAVARDGRVAYETTGVIEGEIAAAPRGTAGFGYDPIFFYPPYGSTLAEVTEDAKLRVAHRGEAFRKLASWLKEGM
ncbi:MAG: non-canonical purine NTP pyrophosphatase [Acidobacteria bacterium]|nr:non-canonical purine NTP pyrophosphatase [Acidobacteriota bacterium]